MANYSTDTDLALYERDVTKFGSSLSTFHAAAKVEIDRRLKKNPAVESYMAANSVTDPASILATDTKTYLATVSAYYVLYLCYNSISISAMDDYDAKAQTYYKRFEQQMGDTKIDIETSGDTYDEDTLRTGDVSL